MFHSGLKIEQNKFFFTTTIFYNLYKLIYNILSHVYYKPKRATKFNSKRLDAIQQHGCLIHSIRLLRARMVEKLSLLTLTHISQVFKDTRRYIQPSQSSLLYIPLSLSLSLSLVFLSFFIVSPSKEKIITLPLSLSLSLPLPLLLPLSFVYTGAFMFRDPSNPYR